MIYSNNLSTLPWYGSIDQQNARKWWIFGKVYPLFIPTTIIPGFQLMRTHREGTIQGAYLYKADGTLVGDYTASLISNGLVVKSFESLGYDVIVYPGLIQNTPRLDAGRYYLAMNDGVESWFSEVFTAVDNIAPYLKLEWWDESDFLMDAGAIVYTEPNYKNLLYLNADLAKPQYNFTEEGEERDGYFYAQKQISEKRFQFKFWASEYMLDVMRLIRMSDHIRITYQQRVYDADSFLLTPEWEEAGDVAAVTAEFDTATVAKKLGQGYIRAIRGDFNDDFNNDYFNQQG